MNDLPDEDIFFEGGILPYPERLIKWREVRGDVTYLPRPVEFAGQTIRTVADLIIAMAFFPQEVPA